MKLYNTLGRQVQTLKLIKEGEVSVYSCGPTVYDYAHIGNLRAFTFADTLRRALESNGLNVKQVMNITDVGHLVSDEDAGVDKLEKGAARENKSVWDVAKQYTQAFLADVQALNILPPTGYPASPDGYARATAFIDPQIAMIKLLVDKGFAYQTKQAIYFDVVKIPNYGQLSGQKLDDKEVAVRTEVVQDPDKHHPQDFAVWFFTIGRFKDHSMQWESPWGNGFPGWHLECSAIIHATLGEPIDIHTGGVDHIGTHHTNEIAQTAAAFDKVLAHYWLHNEFVSVDGQKMSKSLGNYYTLQDITTKGFNPLALRLLFLQSHYRTQMNFTWESLTAAQNRLNDLYAWADLRHQPSTPNVNQALDELSRDTKAAIQKAIDNDLNTPAALSSLSSLVSHMQDNPIPGVEGQFTDETLEFLDSIFGLKLANRPDITEAQKRLLDERHQARAAKQWAKSDEIRDQLANQNIGIRDTSYGQQWYRL